MLSITNPMRFLKPRRITCFQFQYGSIKSVPPEGLTFASPHFNSNMVRLKDLFHQSRRCV